MAHLVREVAHDLADRECPSSHPAPSHGQRPSSPECRAVSHVRKRLIDRQAHRLLLQGGRRNSSLKRRPELFCRKAHRGGNESPLRSSRTAGRSDPAGSGRASRCAFAPCAGRRSAAGPSRRTMRARIIRCRACSWCRRVGRPRRAGRRSPALGTRAQFAATSCTSRRPSVVRRIAFFADGGEPP